MLLIGSQYQVLDHPIGFYVIYIYALYTWMMGICVIVWDYEGIRRLSSHVYSYVLSIGVL